MDEVFGLLEDMRVPFDKFGDYLVVGLALASKSYRIGDLIGFITFITDLHLPVWLCQRNRL